MQRLPGATEPVIEQPENNLLVTHQSPVFSQSRESPTESAQSALTQPMIQMGELNKSHEYQNAKYSDKYSDQERVSVRSINVEEDIENAINS